MKKKYEQLIDRTRSAANEKNAYAFLPTIANTLESLFKSKDASKETRERMARGLDRLVTDNYEFSESELGIVLLDFANDFVDGNLQ
ncbi:hypothetical protein OAF42_03140 [Planctomicrobium sp.]|jgi:hypothetical protein|nr:hypothetical protein [Planctomicrobium sp.]MBT5019030.1 hypothetical protein [Planctomicrobium sp.]MDA7503487.1 hypothetical protein [bacterium]MDB4733419.1 hypothetical protein [Planctomicrobium sp.]